LLHALVAALRESLLQELVLVLAGLTDLLFFSKLILHRLELLLGKPLVYWLLLLSNRKIGLVLLVDFSKFPRLRSEVCELHHHPEIFLIVLRLLALWVLRIILLLIATPGTCSGSRSTTMPWRPTNLAQRLSSSSTCNS